jgi:hypothetical protein
VTCALTLSNGVAVRGRVVDENGAPVGSANVLCATEGGPAGRPRSVWTDGEGRFVFAECEPGRHFTVHAVDNDGRESRQHTGVAPGGEPLELRLLRSDAPRARIVGRLLRPDGGGALGESVDIWRTDPQQNRGAKITAADGSFAVEVVAGAWWLRVMVRGHPWIVVPARELQPGETWNVGDLQLTEGGTVVVEDGGEKISYLVYDKADRFVCGVYARTPPPRSDLIAPGDYVLLARAEGRASRAFPFSIAAGEETRLEVALVDGVRQRFRFGSATGVEPPRYIPFDVRQDGRVVMHDAGSGRVGNPPVAAIWLAPGSYELVTREREPEMRFSFTVGEQEGPALRVPLR